MIDSCRKELPDESRMKYIHRIDNVLFMHGGLTSVFVKYCAQDVDYNDTDAVLEKINSLGRREMWDDASPIWFRPQYYCEEEVRSTAVI